MKGHLPRPTFLEASERIRCLCALYSASVTSGARTAKRNADVGGSDTSKHQLEYGALGWDLVPDEPGDAGPLTQAARILGFKVQPEGDHVHLQAL
jgi:hypothetical protein